MWAEGPDIDPGIIGEPIPRRWPTYILAALQRSGLVKEAPSQALEIHGKLEDQEAYTRDQELGEVCVRSALHDEVSTIFKTVLGTRKIVLDEEELRAHL